MGVCFIIGINDLVAISNLKTQQLGWMIDSDGRPTFRELEEIFAEMAKDPGRFLVIMVSIATEFNKTYFLGLMSQKNLVI